MAGPITRRAAHAARRARARVGVGRRPRWGNLRRQRPFSERYGFDRGTPIDRFYLDRFFADHSSDITGRVLEVKDPSFSDRFGHDVATLDLVDIDPRNLRATVVADLSEAGSLPAETYDCAVVPQTLQYVDDPTAAIANLWQSLRPGGVLLVTAPTVARLDPELHSVERWRLPPAGLRSVLERACVGGEISVVGYGNLVATMAFLLGLAREELAPDDLDANDSDHPIVACGRAQRAPER